MGGEVKKYKSDFETGNDASLPILRTKQSTVTYQASPYHKKKHCHVLSSRNFKGVGVICNVLDRNIKCRA